MYVAALALRDFRSHEELGVSLEPGVTAFLGRNGQGKTNIVEAIDYLSALASHRVSQDAPLVRRGASQAMVSAEVVKYARSATIEVEINPGKANRARLNRAPVSRPRDIVGVIKTVLFSPEDLYLIKGDPSYRRAFLDRLMVLDAPRLGGVKADYDRALKQRNALLKQMMGRASRSGDDYAESTLSVWDDQLVTHGTELIVARDRLVRALREPLGSAYSHIAAGSGRQDCKASYEPSVAQLDLDSEIPLASRSTAAAFHQALAARGKEERQRGLTLVGPHRDELSLSIDDLPVKGYASHGETWSCALALRLASFEVLRDGGDDPILILDDVFAELDAVRRVRLAGLVSAVEQVLITAAVAEDVPEELGGARVHVKQLTEQCTS